MAPPDRLFGAPEKGQSRSARWYQANRERVQAQAKADYRKNPDRFRDKSLKTRFGISLADFDAMSEAQAGLCAICTRALPRGKHCHVDHDHQTGAIRGLLCSNCNVGLGQFKDRPEVLRAAAEYLSLQKAS